MIKSRDRGQFLKRNIRKMQNEAFEKHKIKYSKNTKQNTRKIQNKIFEKYKIKHSKNTKMFVL